ncbi:LLM class flavin-dependent oxidoreductase [Rhodococcus sp. LB1]|uniref:LLM class flavin-dependent oxidoreductase n=1 Tax=Rhodococcus sp. LB1 TaxID=1807499 RepID=UPI00077A3D3A|nr:LLM class flavin-dependent oxidoreductase [Rhodococcus sp. LB1]KXX59634.1 luciferase [Rhodococcus sp. LB1]
MSTVCFPVLSVLDLVPVRDDQSTSDAINATLSLAKLADRIGYRRYWVAEHHNMLASAGTNPPVLVAMLADATERIRVGSGAVLLPNHTPFVVAEQFALLEAAHPCRIDLGIGRSSGTDPITSDALRHGVGGIESHGVMSYPQHIDSVIAMMKTSGIEMTVAGRRQTLRATAKATTVPQVWLLGASSQSARLAGQKGMPYVFGHHLGVGSTAEALHSYRSSFEPSPQLAEPQTILPIHASVADTYDEAYRAALPWLLVMLGLRTGQPQAAVKSIEQAEKIRLPPAHKQIVDAMANQWVIGGPDDARAQIEGLAATYAVDEVMIHPVSGTYEGADPRSSPGREQTLRLLAV